MRVGRPSNFLKIMKKFFILLITILAVNLVLPAHSRSVTITVYNEGRQTADGSIIPWQKVKNGTIHWCAISPDLLKKNGGPYEFGDIIHIEGTEDLDGDYVIHDLTSKRHRNWVDLLVPPSKRHGKWKGKIKKRHQGKKR